MVRELNMDTQRQNFWKESIKKEAYVRLHWLEKYNKDFNRARSSLNRPRREVAPPVVPKSQSASLPAIKRQGPWYGKKKEKASDFLLEKEGDPNALLVEMRPVSSQTRKLLYDGFSKEGTGRYQYLAVRKLQKPEVKYEFPLTSAWEYGWKLNEVVSEMKAPHFGRSRIVQDTFYRNKGIIPLGDIATVHV
ncbi:protein SPMIP1-like [Branchiostoma lanceolatum]|uniref:protein SPMIP1-like n=1 Tax=Branchiostoma lanceolatum TaxID=7740 RepID=UPI001132BC73